MGNPNVAAEGMTKEERKVFSLHHWEQFLNGMTFIYMAR